LEAGQIVITISKAKDLERKSKFVYADPYVEVAFGNQKSKSPTVKYNNNPEWNFTTKVNTSKESTGNIVISVFDEDAGNDDPLGNICIDTYAIQSQKQILNQWIPLQNCKSGELLFSSEFIPVNIHQQQAVEESTSKVDLKIIEKSINLEKKSTKIETQISDAKKQSSMLHVKESMKQDTLSSESVPAEKLADIIVNPKNVSQTKLEAGQIVITISKAKDLERKSKFVYADPYVEVAFGNQKSKSPTVKYNNNPEWNFTTKVNTSKESTGNIVISVFDEDAGNDDPLGNICIDTYAIQSQKQILNQWIPLQNCKSGELLFSSEFIPLSIHQQQAVEESTKDVDLKIIEKSINSQKKSTNIETKISDGEVEFTVHKARKLENKEKFGKIDPYFVLSFGNQHFKSKTIKNEENPAWEVLTKLNLDENSPNQINISVFDDDFGKDDCLGDVDINLNEIIMNKQIKHKWVTLKNCKSGEVQISMQFLPAEDIARKVDKSTLETQSFTKKESLNEDNIFTKIDSTKMKEAMTRKPQIGTLNFTLISANDLENSDYIGKSDPYALIQYKGETFRTQTMNSNLNPVWNFPITLDINEEDPDVIHVQIFDEDYDQDDAIGRTTINVKELIDSNSIDTKLFKLEDCKSGEIKISSSYSKIITEEDTEQHQKEKNIQEIEYIELDDPSVNTNSQANEILFTLVGAKDLENSDYFGKSDPYVVVHYKEVMFKSQTINNNLNPVWNFSINLEIDLANPGELHIQVFDEDYDSDDKIGKTIINVKDLIDCKSIEGKWVKLEDCKSGEIQFSSKYTTGEIIKPTGESLSSITGKLEFDLKASEPKYNIIQVSQKQPNTTTVADYSQNFDKIVKKSCKKIIRRIDSEGNVVEEVVEEGKTPENWETSTLNMASGIEVVTGHKKVTNIKKTIDEFGNVISEDIQTSFDKDPELDINKLQQSGFSAIPMKKTSIKRTKRIIKRIDEEGNILEEIIDDGNDESIPTLETMAEPVSFTRTSTQTSKKIIKRISTDGNVVEEVISETGDTPDSFNFSEFSSLPQSITTKRSVSSKKIIRTVDSEGNVSEKIIHEGDSDISFNEQELNDQYKSYTPLTSNTSVTKRRIVRTIDNEGNVTENISDEGDIDTENFNTQFMSMQPATTKTSFSSQKIIKTIDSEGNVTEKIVNEGDFNSPKSEDELKTSFLSSIPVAVKTTSLKTSRKVIRKSDESGNIIEEIIDDPLTEASNWEQLPTEKDFSIMCTTVKRTIDASGNVVDEKISVTQPDNPIAQNFESLNLNLQSSMPSAVKRTSVKTTKSVIKRIDEKGNVIEEIINDNDPIIESEVWERESVEVPTSLQVTSTSTSMTTVKRTVDEFGNLIDEETSTIETKDPTPKSTKVSVKSMPGATLRNFPESQPNGKLIFILHNAKQLENKEWIGKSDPYAVVSLGQIVFKTETISNNLNPEFEHEMVFQINRSSPSSINIELFDEDITRDDCLGNTMVDIIPIKKQGKVSKETKRLSNCKSGTIMYSAEFIPEVEEQFTDSSIEISEKGPRKPKPVKEAPGGHENTNVFVQQMANLGIENIELVSDDKNQDVLLKDVIDRQTSTKQKISGLMRTIKQVEIDPSDGSSEVLTRTVIRKIDSQGNVVEEIIEDPNSDNVDHQLGEENIETISHSTVKKTIKILDNEGNVVEERVVEEMGDGNNLNFSMPRNTSSQSNQKSFVNIPGAMKSSYVIRKEISSESEKSPTIEDIVYSEYPHLTKPMDQLFDSVSSHFATSSHAVRYFHSSNEPFQNITSLRAHFVLAFDEDVPDIINTDSNMAIKDVRFNDPFNNFYGNSKFNINRSHSESTQVFSSTHSFSGSEFSSTKSSAKEENNKVKTSGTTSMPLYMLASEEPSLEELVSESSVSSWMEPIISGNCLGDKEFWKSSDNIPSIPSSQKEHSHDTAFFSSSSHSSSPEQCPVSGPHSLRSPVSMLKSSSPVLSFQSLPSSPRKKNSVKKVITSELFSSDKDITRSLELVYTEPNEDPKEKLSSIYKSVCLNKEKENLDRRKPSFTQLKRPSIDTQLSQYEILSNSSSPEWRLSEGKSVDFSPCNLKNEFSLQTKSSSLTETIPLSPTSPQKCQISQDICSKNPPCCKLFEPKSPSSVCSPERKFQYVQGSEEQFSANIEETVESSQKSGTSSPSHPRPASSSFDEDSEPESPRSPSPKVSPGSKSPSPRVSLHNSHPELERQTSSPYGESSGASSHGSSRNDLGDIPNNDVAPLMKETDQELLDEMIVKDVPESESSTDPVKKFEEAHPSVGIDSIQEDQEDASDSEYQQSSKKPSSN